MASQSPNQSSRRVLVPPMLQQSPQFNSSFRNRNVGSGSGSHYHNGGNGGNGNGGGNNWMVHHYHCHVENRDLYAHSYTNGYWGYPTSSVYMPLVTPHQYYYGNPIIPPPHQVYVPPMVNYTSPYFNPFNYSMYNPSVGAPPQIYHARPLSDQGFELCRKIVTQVDYYFSIENLRGDTYLKSLMDAHGWVLVTLIANFPRMQRLTNDIEYILFALQSSTVVEVRGYKVRRRRRMH